MAIKTYKVVQPGYSKGIGGDRVELIMGAYHKFEEDELTQPMKDVLEEVIHPSEVEVTEGFSKEEPELVTAVVPEKDAEEEAPAPKKASKPAVKKDD